jgi:hypothetical protein
MCPETFGVFAVKVDKYGAWRLITNSQKPAIGGHFSDYWGWFVSAPDCLAGVGGFELPDDEIG